MKVREKRLLLGGGAALLAGATAIILANRSKEKHPPLDVAQNVDLHKYIGDWYEIARLPARFEKSCYKSKAHYSLNEDGTIEVLNSCHKGSPEGRLKKSRGKAFIKDSETNARLKVQFFWPFRGDYQIIDLDKNYQYAMVGSDNRKYLWILSRTPELNISVVRDLMDKAVGQGFDTSNLIFTPQE